MPTGIDPTEIVAITAFVAPLITDTVLLPRFATYTVFVAGLTAIPRGVPPTVMSAVTVFVAPLITETVPAP